MFSSILKIIPKLDAAAVSAMEKGLQGRFTKVAKGFAGGIVSALKGGAVGAAILSIVDKLLNPLQDLKTTIDKTIADADNVKTYASDFGSTSGELAKLLGLGKATGLDESAIFTMLSKLQGKIAETKLNPDEPSSVKQFKDETNTVHALFSVMQALGKEIDPNKRVAIQNDIFGEKLSLKSASFRDAFKNGAIRQLLSETKLDTKSGAELTNTTDILAAMKHLRDVGIVINDFDDMKRKANLIRPGTIDALNNAEAQANARTNKLLSPKELQRLIQLEGHVEDIKNYLQSLLGKVGTGDLIGAAMDIDDSARKNMLENIRRRHHEVNAGGKGKGK